MPLRSATRAPPLPRPPRGGPRWRSPAASARPARPPKPDCRSVAREPRTAGTSIPPCRATYARQPERRPVKRSTLPGRARTLAPGGTGHAPRSARSSTAPRSAPATAKRSGARKSEGRPRHRALERRGARRVADRAVGHGVGARVHRSRSAHPDPAVPRAAGVLHRRQQAGLEHLDDRRGRGRRDRRRGLGRRQLRHRDEAHAVAGGEEGRLRAEGVEEAPRGPPDEPPAAGRGDGVDAGLPPRDGHRSRRDADAWRGVARGLEGLRQEPEVGEPGREAEHEDGVRPARVQPDEVAPRTGRARARARRGRARPLRRTPPATS